MITIAGMSPQAAILLARLRLARRKRVYADLGTFHESIRENQRSDPARPPAWVHDQVSVRCTEVRGRPCYTLEPFRPARGKHVLYFHGGAYVHQILSDHWAFFVRLIERTGCTVTAVIYPLAPQHTCADTVPMVAAAYDEILGQVDPADQVLMGDSAGGALTLVIAESLEEAGRPQPKEVVLLSPWLDVTMTDPRQPELDRKDPYLAVNGLRAAGRMYADNRNPRDPRVSPLFGPLSALDRVSVFVGTRDVLLADARNLRDEAERRGVEIAYHEYEQMIHAWPLMSIPEGRDALERIASLVERAPVPGHPS
ncbi:acetyl esterase/lipase [Prauserella shujinwangii]|uniref:Acetyl esterase/lipase n=1 Tax=Prauserella shujinwangii TaxID=1453103 RepID=A0A2T0LN32_9PSEU|nr:alpha/beta hydrolase [Prauserella shujinwangii]PRX44594.1 acetyl esterase/lipase [Prauserella shujinwangii]